MTEDNRACDLIIGDPVEKITGDYRIKGHVRSVFTTKSGAVRVVVEHEAEGGGSFCHIYNRSNLRKLPMGSSLQSFPQNAVVHRLVEEAISALSRVYHADGQIMPTKGGLNSYYDPGPLARVARHCRSFLEEALEVARKTSGGA